MLEFCGNSKIFGPDNKFEIESKLLGKFNLNVLLKMSDFFFQKSVGICWRSSSCLVIPDFLFSADQLNLTTHNMTLVIVMVITWYSEQSKVPKF